MKIPSFLHKTGMAHVDSTVYDDLRLSKIFSGIALFHITRPLDGYSILMRQNFFRSLEDPDFYEKISDLYATLRAFESSKRKLAAAGNEQEKIFLKIKYFRFAISALEKLRTLPRENEIAESVVQYFCAQCYTDFFAKTRADFCEIDKLLEKIRVLDISFSDRIKLYPDRDSKSYCEEVSDIAKAFSVSKKQKRNFSAALDKSVSKAIVEFFKNEYSLIEDLLPILPDDYEKTLLEYMNELEFYLSISEFFSKFESDGIALCYPLISQEKQYYAKNVRDAYLLKKGFNTVPNDICFSAAKGFYFLIGANSGGKTTYLRTAAINLLLFLSGCKIFAEEACIYPFKNVFTHFPKDERFDGVSRFDEELQRANQILNVCDDESFVFVNEAFSGTDEKTGSRLALTFANTAICKRAFGLFVTHFKNVKDDNIPVLFATLDKNNHPTYKIQPSSHKEASFVDSIIKKYRLDKDSLMTRLKYDE